MNEKRDGMKRVNRPYVIAFVIAAAAAGAFVFWRAGILKVSEEVTLPPYSATHR